MDFSRREFIKFVSNQSIALSMSPVIAGTLVGCKSSPKPTPLKGIAPNREDRLSLLEGLKYNVICQWGDRINTKDQSFGFNNDFTCYFPMENRKQEGLLWVNHESVIPQFIHNKPTNQLTRSINEVVKEQEAVGGSILHIKKTGEEWNLVSDSRWNRRIHGRTKIPFSHGYKIMDNQTAVGTLANCAGGKTPWNTVLTSEENYGDFYGEVIFKNKKRTFVDEKKLRWNKHFPLPPEHYGWIVEVDPFTGEAEKQVLLGRAPHEGATVVTTKDDRVVVYMAEDRNEGFLFKFVSDGTDLKKGTLYAADTLKGRWLPLDIDQDDRLKKVFNSQLQVLTYSHYAAETVGATPQDRPEDVEIHPETGDVFIALTKNKQKGNYHGGLLKISGQKDHDSLEFKSDIWLSGGLKSGMACPDNLCFDAKGNLWVTTDINENDMGMKEYSEFGNNGLFYIPMKGLQAGQPILVATAPVDAELTGPWFSPDYKTLFLSVQHPGSSTRRNLKRPTSTFPHGKTGQLPRPAVVAIQGSFFDQVMS